VTARVLRRLRRRLARALDWIGELLDPGTHEVGL